MFPTTVVLDRRTARSPRGARRAAAWGWAALAAGLLVLAAMPAAAIEKQLGPPPWRSGGRLGFTCDAATYPDSSGYHLEVYLRVPPATLRQLARDNEGDARLRATLRVKNRYSSRELESSQDFKIALEDTALGQGRVMLMRFPVAPGTCKLSARLEDLNPHKGGLRTVTLKTEIQGELEVPKPQATRDLSDIEFAWPSENTRGASLAFVRGGRVFIPNADRLYGLYASTMEVAFTARARPGDERPWRWVMRVLDVKGQVVAQQESTSAAGVLAQGAARFDISTQPAGLYYADMKAWQDGDDGALQRRAKFSIGWKADTWNRSGADIADDVHFLLEGRDEDEFLGLQPGQQEKMLADFWRRRDPTPETAFNEAEQTFHDRVQLANAEYSRFGIGKGMFSDQGRVFIRYGTPDEILHQVMPAGDETLTKQLLSIIATEDRVMGSVNQKGPGGDQRPYEVWIYEGDIPLPFDTDPDAQVVRVNKRHLLFLFVDEQGLGTFTLRYSTE
jgi:GWxTD domain-containing protein